MTQNMFAIEPYNKPNKGEWRLHIHTVTVLKRRLSSDCLDDPDGLVFLR